MMGDEHCGWRSQVFVGDTMKNCQHNWQENSVIPEAKYLYCTFCKMITTDTMRIHCLTCKMTSCPSCSKYYLHKTIPMKKQLSIPPYQKQDDIIKELLDYTQHLQATLNNTKGKSILLDTVIDSDDDILPSFVEEGSRRRKVSFEFLKVKRLSLTAKIPERRTVGAAGYDIFIDQNITIPAHERILVSTGISLEFPDNCYARLVSRSGAAVKQGIDIGAGVIDADYRGEIKLLVLNNSNNSISLQIGESIAQFILERIITPSIEEVDSLTSTERGEGAFGSTELAIMTPENPTELVFSAPTKSLKVSFEFLKVKRLSLTAKIPERRTVGAAGYDIFIDQNITIPAHERILVSTGISLEFPDNCYARLVSRSGAAVKQGIDIGAGVKSGAAVKQGIDIGAGNYYSLNRRSGFLDINRKGRRSFWFNRISNYDTGISLEFPDNCYARLVSRSGAAVKQGIDIGVGVIDADYRGEIKLLVLDNSNNSISLQIGESIAQFILERIITPSIEEVDSLTELAIMTPENPTELVQAILDTGATKCCICQDALPKEAFEEINYKVDQPGNPSQRSGFVARNSRLIPVETNILSCAGNPRPSNYNKNDVEDIHKEEFAGVFLNYQDDTDEEEELQYTRQKNNKDKFSQGRWDTLGEPSGKYDYLVRYDIPSNFFETEIPPPTGWDDEEVSEIVCPSIWEDTPWEDDPEFDPNDLAEESSDINGLNGNQEEEDPDPESYYLGLQNQEMDYPSFTPSTCMPFAKVIPPLLPFACIAWKR
ncbi:hypothetical protein ZIOFF_073131 [Zingiber officinale]|uniref:dUTP diphosphatase n=1 Tax=Zingiber officinale TaxID=94328 RepID=A0A8J5BZP2_ZINOF|nr:hypothetical protein ZIOFF_073131 [Zingiber officinale]